LRAELGRQPGSHLRDYHAICAIHSVFLDGGTKITGAGLATAAETIINAN
jgi:hypothetical protein